MSLTADIEVKYVNAVKPGKKLGSIKCSDDQFFLVPPSMLALFSPGMKCKVEYTSKVGADGTDWRTITKQIGSNSMTPAVPSNNYRQRNNPAEAKAIFVSVIMKEWATKIPVGDSEALAHAVRAAILAYDMTLGGVQAQRRDDLDDSIDH